MRESLEELAAHFIEVNRQRDSLAQIDRLSPGWTAQQAGAEIECPRRRHSESARDTKCDIQCQDRLRREPARDLNPFPEIAL